VIPLRIIARRGETTDIPIRVEQSGIAHARIAALIVAAPLRVTAPGHGIPDGWRAAIVNARGVGGINARHDPPGDADLRRVRRIDADTLEFPGVNGYGMSGRHAPGTGQIAFYPPLDLGEFSGARMEVKDAPGGRALAIFATPGALANDEELAGRLEIDAAGSTIWLRLTATQTEALAFSTGFFDIELLDGDRVVAICPANSTLAVREEITTVE
jgi:hypothetical protein